MSANTTDKQKKPLPEGHIIACLLATAPDCEATPKQLDSFMGATLAAFVDASDTFMQLDTSTLGCAVCGKTAPAGDLLPVPFIPQAPGLPSVMIPVCTSCLTPGKFHELEKAGEAAARRIKELVGT